MRLPVPMEFIFVRASRIKFLTNIRRLSIFLLLQGLIFPNLRYFDLGGENGTWAGPHPEWPLIKPLLTAWQASPAAENWVHNANASIPLEIKRLINHAMYALHCHNYDTWTRCVDLEAKQKRV